jgi:hypothetical protein
MGLFRRLYKVTHFGLRMLHLPVPFGPLRDGCMQRVRGDFFYYHLGIWTAITLSRQSSSHSHRQICYQHEDARVLSYRISKKAKISILDTVIGQLYVAATLVTGTQPLLPVDWERGWNLESVDLLWRREKFIFLLGMRWHFLYQPIHCLVTTSLSYVGSSVRHTHTHTHTHTHIYIYIYIYI